MVPPDRSMPRLNPLRWTGSCRYARTTRKVARSVGIRQRIVRVRKGRRIVPPMVGSPRRSSPGMGGREAASGWLLGFGRRRVARGDAGDRALEHPDAGVGRVVDPEGDLVLV